MRRRGRRSRLRALRQEEGLLLTIPRGEPLSNLIEPRPWANMIFAIAHKAKALHLRFILNRSIMLKCKPELIMNGLKIMCMKMEHRMFLDSVSFLPCPLRKLHEAFELTARK